MNPGHRTGNRKPRAAWAVSSLAGSALLLVAAASPAAAQFSFFGSGEASTQDVVESIASHGFRMVGPLYRNGRVYVADVLDRRQRRERLIIAADSGQIIQRFFVAVSPPGGSPLGRGASEAMRYPGDGEQRRASRDDQGDFFSRLTRGWDDEPPPRPPLGLDNQGEGAVSPRVIPAPRVVRPQPRVVTRTEEAPITASPLPPPPAVAKPPQAPAASASAPAESAPPSNGRPTTVVLDPLRIPGQRPAAAKAAPATVAATKPAEPAPAAKPAPKAVPATDVPVAPLD